MNHNLFCISSFELQNGTEFLPQTLFDVTEYIVYKIRGQRHRVANI